MDCDLTFTFRSYKNMKKMLFLMLLFNISAFAQQKFDIKNASKSYDVRLEVAKCNDWKCEGDAKFSIFKKGQRKPFQVVKTPTEFMIEEARRTNTKLMYDYQSAVFFEDYNFDGIEDLAIRDGNNGGYGGPSYQIYLFSPKSRKFVHNDPITDLNQGEYLGMMEVDKKKKVLRTFSKSGCCWHQTKEYAFINNRPKKVYEWTQDATIPDENNVQITTKRLIKGKWITSTKLVKREQ